MQDTLTHSLLISEVSSELLESLEEDKKVMEQIPAIRFDSDLYEHVSLLLDLVFIFLQVCYINLICGSHLVHLSAFSYFEVFLW